MKHSIDLVAGMLLVLLNLPIQNAAAAPHAIQRIRCALHLSQLMLGDCLMLEQTTEYRH